MAILERVWVIHTTSRQAEAGTDARFSLEIQTRSQRFAPNFPRLPHDERNRGRTDQYEFDLRDVEIDHEDVEPGNIRITILGRDRWLPESIWIVGRDRNGGFHLLVARPAWPSNAWFSTRPGDMATRPLDQR